MRREVTVTTKVQIDHMPVAKLPEITLPDGQVVQVIQPLRRNLPLPAGFPAWPEATQRNAVTALEEFLQDVRRNGSIEHMSELGLIDPGQAIRDQRPLDGPRLKLDLIDRCNWQLAQFLRVSHISINLATKLRPPNEYSNPTRISEATGALRVVLEGYNRIYGGPAKDPVPILYFAVALSKTPGEEERALREFQDGLSNIAIGPEAPVKNLLWAKSNLARLLRHLNRVPEAEEQEKFIR